MGMIYSQGAAAPHAAGVPLGSRSLQNCIVLLPSDIIESLSCLFLINPVFISKKRRVILCKTNNFRSESS